MGRLRGSLKAFRASKGNLESKGPCGRDLGCSRALCCPLLDALRYYRRGHTAVPRRAVPQSMLGAPAPPDFLAAMLGVAVC